MMNTKAATLLLLTALTAFGCRRSDDPGMEDMMMMPPPPAATCPVGMAPGICDLKYVDSPVHPALGDPIQLTEVLVTTPTISVSSRDGVTTIAGFYVQDVAARDALGGHYSGILATYYPNDVAGDGAPTVGSIVTLDGTFAEFGADGFTKQKQIQVARITNSGQTGQVTPITISDISVIGRGGAEAPAYEGVLVKVESVAITNTEVQINGMNYFGAFEVANSLVVSGSWQSYRQPQLQETFTSITGILRAGTAPFEAGEYLLTPRVATDLAPENQAQNVTSIRDIQDANAPGHPQNGCFRGSGGTQGKCATADLQNVLVTAVGGYVSRNLRSLWVQDTTVADGKYSGVKVVYNPSQITYLPEVGHRINVSGEIIEYYDGTQIQYPTIVREGTATEMVVPTIVSNSADIARDNPNARQYEGVLVTVQNVSVTEACFEDSRGRDFGGFILSGNVMVGTAFSYDYNGDFRSSDVECFDAMDNPTGLCGCNVPMTGTSRPNDLRTNGDTFTSVTGLIDFAYGDFQLMVRGNEDLQQ